MLIEALIGGAIMHAGCHVHVRPDLVGKARFEAGIVLYVDGKNAYVQDNMTLVGVMLPQSALVADDQDDEDDQKGREGRDKWDDSDSDDGDYEGEAA